MNDWLDGGEDQGGVLHQYVPWLVEALEIVSAVFDLFAIAILMLGAVRFVWGCVRGEIAHEAGARVRAMNRERMELGRYILASLELLIVSDIVHTALTLKLSDLLFLGLLVLIRSAISFFLEREMDGLKKELGT